MDLDIVRKARVVDDVSNVIINPFKVLDTIYSFIFTFTYSTPDQ